MLLIILFTVFSQVLATIKIESLPISPNFKSLEQGSTIVDRDRARFQALFKRHEKRAKLKGVGLSNRGSGYTLSVGFGSPPTYYQLIVDTGSPYTWIGPGRYVETKTSIKQGHQSFSITYDKGRVTCARYKDLVTFTTSLNISNMEFGVADSTEAMNFNGYDGILGLGPAASTKDVVTPKNVEPMQAIMDALFAQKKIQRNVFGLSFAPITSPGIVNGRLSLGGTDPKKYTGKLNWVGIKNKQPWNDYWGFEQTIKYGKQTIQPSSVGIVDSGTTLIYITPGGFKAYSESIPGSKIDKQNGLLEIPKESFDGMKFLSFVINGIPYELTPNAQIWPRTFNHILGGKADVYYSVVSALNDRQLTEGCNFILGYVFLERFYTAYDASTSRIGFANSPSTFVDVN